MHENAGEVQSIAMVFRTLEDQSRQEDEKREIWSERKEITKEKTEPTIKNSLFLFPFGPAIFRSGLSPFVIPTGQSSLYHPLPSIK